LELKNGEIIPIAGRVTPYRENQMDGNLEQMDIQTQGLKDADINPENFGVIHLHKIYSGTEVIAAVFFANRMTTNVDSISNQL